MKIKNIIIIIISLAIWPVSAQILYADKLEKKVSIDGMYIEKDGTIYTAEGWDGTKINKISPDGKISEFSSGHKGPIDIVKGKNGNFYISEWQGSSVTIVDKNDGKIIKVIPTKPGPGPMAKDSSGNIYVTHNLNDGSGYISKISPDDEVSIFSSDKKLINPGGIDIDTNGNIYVVNFNNANLIQFKTDKTCKIIATLPGSNRWKSGYLKVVKDRIYISGAQENKIYNIDFSGKIHVFIDVENATINQNKVVDTSIFQNIQNPIGLGYDQNHDILYLSSGFVKNKSIMKVKLPIN